MLPFAIITSALAISTVLAVPISSNEIYGRSFGSLEVLAPVTKRQDIGDYRLKKRATQAPTTRSQTKTKQAATPPRAATAKPPSNKSTPTRNPSVSTKPMTPSRGMRAPPSDTSGSGSGGGTGGTGGTGGKGGGGSTGGAGSGGTGSGGSGGTDHHEIKVDNVFLDKDGNPVM